MTFTVGPARPRPGKVRPRPGPQNYYLPARPGPASFRPRPGPQNIIESWPGPWAAGWPGPCRTLLYTPARCRTRPLAVVHSLHTPAPCRTFTAHGRSYTPVPRCRLLVVTAPLAGPPCLPSASSPILCTLRMPLPDTSLADLCVYPERRVRSLHSLCIYVRRQTTDRQWRLTIHSIHSSTLNIYYSNAAIWTPSHLRPSQAFPRLTSNYTTSQDLPLTYGISQIHLK